MTSTASLSTMNDRNHRAGLWALLALGVLLMLFAAIAKADDSAYTAKRTDRFNGTLPSGSTLRIENVSGDIVATAGREFSAVVTVTVNARTQQRADELLRDTTVLQKRDGDELALRALWPYSERGTGKHSQRTYMDPDMRMRRRGETRCEDCRITAQFQVTVPPGVRMVLRTVNGEVRSDGPDGELDLQSVNGAVVVRGGRHGVSAESVNGRIDVVMQDFPAAASIQAKTVNGSVLVTLPKDAKFDLAASTMNGTIASTFPLPPRAAAGETPEPPTPPDTPRPPTAKPEPHPRPAPRRVVVERDGDDVIVDVEALQKEIEESMKEVDAQVQESLRQYNREMRKIKVVNLHRDYAGAIGQGGGRLRVTTLNGTIAVLASGTREADAKALIPERQAFAVTIPAIRVSPKAVVRVAPHAVITGEPDEQVVRGDVAGDFLATAGERSYRIGRVSGNVKILTQSGEIHVGSAGAGADLKTSGGDIVIGPVTGDLKAQTLAGEIRAGAVSGSAVLETSGGDIRVERIGGSAGARTAGGDIVLHSVRGGVEAETGGGDVRVAVLSREVKGGVSIRDSGGDVTLTLPSDFRGDVELEVQDADQEENLIRSDFPEVAVTRQHSVQRGSGVLNGGGPKVVVRTHSGTIRLRKGPAGVN